MARRPFVAGNWKMHKTAAEAAAWVAAAAGRLPAGLDVAVCAPYTALAATVEAARGTDVAVYAQNAHWEPKGAYTGEISLPMLLDVGVDGVLLGHSERRAYFNETDEALRQKLAAAHEAGLAVILAVGEREEERAGGRTEAVLRRQVDGAFAGLPADRAAATTVAYEPVWAIGTGRTATPETAQAAHAHIRGLLAAAYGDDVAGAVRIQYGGSVNADNAAALMAQPDVDGALVGGASLEPDTFVALLAAAASAP